ncbi:MAG: type III secretion system chaperone [Pseudomonadota bacterium]
MTLEEVNIVFGEFGAAIELPDLRLDETGYASILTEKETVFTFEHVEEEGALVIYTSIAAIVPERREMLFEEMLRANFFWRETLGATLAISPDGRFALLMTSLPVANLTVETLTRVYLNIAQLTEAWYARIEEIFDGAALPETEEPESDRGGPEPAAIPPSGTMA